MGWAGITAQFDGPPITAAHTDDRVLVLDEHQYGAGDGPCLRAMRTGEQVRAGRSDIEREWPLLGLAATATGLRSVLAVPLHLHGSAVGALNLYSADSAVPEPDRDVLSVLIEYARRGFTAYQHRGRREDPDGTELRRAVAGWTAVEQAVGTLMQQHGFSASYARQVLGDLAQDWERTLFDQACTSSATVATETINIACTVLRSERLPAHPRSQDDARNRYLQPTTHIGLLRHTAVLAGDQRG